MIQILATGPANSVQDNGRFGMRAQGISTTGTMDPLSLVTANLLLGNAEDAAVLEIQSFPLPTRFAVTGAAAPMRFGDLPFPANACGMAAAGQDLVIDRPTVGARCYLALPGGIKVDPVLGSASTHLRNGFGGFQGRDIAVGDRLSATRPDHTGPQGTGLAPAMQRIAATDARPLQIRVVPGADLHLFPTDRQDTFWATDWQISPQSNRSGYRLRGGALTLPEPVSLLSYGLVPGIIQVPPSGEPIIQVADANTAGGYPRIGGVIEADLWKLAQARIGTRLRFEPVDFDTARMALAEIDAYLAEVRHAARMLA